MGKVQKLKTTPKAKKQDFKEVEQVPEDLKNLMGSVRAIVTIHTLLNTGMFKGDACKSIQPSLQFLESLHAQNMALAIDHPKAHLDPDLKAAIDSKKEKEEGEQK